MFRGSVRKRGGTLSGLDILVVDDDPEVMRQLKALLPETAGDIPRADTRSAARRTLALWPAAEVSVSLAKVVYVFLTVL